jgi:hypothetical protein
VLLTFIILSKIGTNFADKRRLLVDSGRGFFSVLVMPLRNVGRRTLFTLQMNMLDGKQGMILILINNHLTLASQLSDEILSVVVHSCLSSTWLIIKCFGMYFTCYDSYPFCNCFIMVFCTAIASLGCILSWRILHQCIWFMEWITNEWILW